MCVWVVGCIIISERKISNLELNNSHVHNLREQTASNLVIVVIAETKCEKIEELPMMR